MIKRGSNGFTLIELLIVIILIGILSGVLISVIDPVRIYNRGKYAKAESDMTKFIGAVEVVRVNTGLQLGRITNVWCSSCGVCDGDLRESSGTCYTNWIAARDAVNTAGQGQVDLNSINRDPWGSPYLLDESEGDPSEASCVYDTISSAGPDGISGTSDDISFTIPFYSCR